MLGVYEYQADMHTPRTGTGRYPRPTTSPGSRTTTIPTYIYYTSPSPSTSSSASPAGGCIRLPATITISVPSIVCTSVSSTPTATAAFVQTVADIMAKSWTASTPNLPLSGSSVTGKLSARGSQLIVDVDMDFRDASATPARVLAGANNFNGAAFTSNSQFRTKYGVTVTHVSFQAPLTLADSSFSFNAVDRNASTPPAASAAAARIVVPLIFTLTVPSFICGQIPDMPEFKSAFTRTLVQSWGRVSSQPIQSSDIVYSANSFDTSNSGSSKLVIRVSMNLPPRIKTLAVALPAVQSFVDISGDLIMDGMADTYGISHFAVKTGKFGPKY